VADVVISLDLSNITGLIVMPPGSSALFLGIVDIEINGQKNWNNVRANITISERKIIEIKLDESAVVYHFGIGQLYTV
jgi:hypothetical protein